MVGEGQHPMAIQVQDIVVAGPLDEVVDSLRARWHTLVPALVAPSPAEIDAVRAPLQMALLALDEALLRLGMALPGEPEDAQDDPLVFPIQSGVRPD